MCLAHLSPCMSACLARWQSRGLWGPMCLVSGHLSPVRCSSQESLGSVQTSIDAAWSSCHAPPVTTNLSTSRMHIFGFYLSIWSKYIVKYSKYIAHFSGYRMMTSWVQRLAAYNQGRTIIVLLFSLVATGDFSQPSDMVENLSNCANSVLIIVFTQE